MDEKSKENQEDPNVFKPESLLFKFLWKFFPGFVDYIAKAFRGKTKK